MRQGRFGTWYHLATWNIFPIHPWRMVWMLPPKTASTSVRHALASHAGLSTDDVHGLVEFQGLRKADALTLQQDGYVVVGSTRHPVPRLASCWADKIASKDYYVEFTTFDEFTPGMPFADFVDAVAKIPDEDAEPHFRSLSFDLVHGGVVIPDLLLEQNTLAADWNRLRARVAWRSSPSVWLPDLTVRRTSSWRDLVGEIPLSTIATIHERYADDFTAFGYDPDVYASADLLRSPSASPNGPRSP